MPVYRNPADMDIMLRKITRGNSKSIKKLNIIMNKNTINQIKLFKSLKYF